MVDTNGELIHMHIHTYVHYLYVNAYAHVAAADCNLSVVRLLGVSPADSLK